MPEYDPDRVSLVGLPIRPEFVPSGTKEEYKSKVGISSEKMVLVVGGGDGMGPIVDITKSIAASLPEGATVTAICGSNAAAKEEIERECPSAIAMGYVTNMPEVSRTVSRSGRLRSINTCLTGIKTTRQCARNVATS